jgi:hypothetical protein
LSRKDHTFGRSASQGGWSLIELTVTLALLMGIALFGIKTMASAFMLQNWSIAQSMTDAYAGIETAYAQRCVFSVADIENSKRWGAYPAAVTTTQKIGSLPSLSVPPTAATARPVTATVIRTYRKISYTDPVTGAVSYTDPITGAVSYLLESYVVYQDGQRKYCKVSKVYRSE